MTNLQQNIANSGSEFHDEVHLTELLPVEQSRFSETVGDKDNDATDALKALRSFAHCSNDEFASRYVVRNDIDEEEEDDEEEQEEDHSTEQWKQLDIESEFTGRIGNKTNVRKEMNKQQYDDRSELDSNDSQSEELGKEKCFTDENTEINSNPKKSSKKRKRKNVKSEVPKEFKRNVIKARKPDKEVTQTIDAIIQKNFLLEQENNNVPQIQKFTYRIINPTAESNESGTIDNQIAIGNQEHKKYGCIMCDAKFKGTGGLRNHYKVMHGAGPIFKCNECGKEFPLKERLKLHVRTHTGFRPYKCNECEKTFARGGQLAQHRRTHSQVKPYRCTLCTGMFTCSANLSIHMKRHNGQKDHKCDICGRGFVRRDALKKHLECLHQDVKSFLCVICNKTFKGHLPQHMRTHAQDRPHGCATCGQRFAQKSQLTVHQRTHSGQRPFRCLVCWQAFAHSTALKLHTRRHTGERPFKCVECNAGFTQLPHWKKHMRCIHGRNEPYCCQNCKIFFRIKSDLENHEKECLEVAPKETSMDPSILKNSKYCGMSIEKMRLLLAVLLKRISKPEKLEELGFGKRLIDEILEDSLIAAGKDPVNSAGSDAHETLRTNLEIFLEWTVPQEHWKNFQKKKKTPEQILETLTAT